MATNYANASYQEILDVNTVKGNVTIIGIHTPTGSTPVRRLSGFFSQFRKFRYKGCAVQVVPAATLPADPLQVGFEAGENTIDMRDMLNPILFHGTHGESLQIAWNNIFYNHDRFDGGALYGHGSYEGGASFDADDVNFHNVTNSPLETQYYQAITDKTWRKFGIQSTFKLPFMCPRVWKATTTYPILANPHVDVGSMNTGPNYAGGTIPLGSIFDGGNGNGLTQKVGADGEVLDQHWMSSGTTPLGWLPTVTMPVIDGNTTYPAPATVLPKIFMGILVLPPCYLQELYFRVIVTHYYEFKGFTASLAPASVMPENKGTYENAVKQTAGGKAATQALVDDDQTLESPTANVIRVSDGVF
uniref:Putative capsid protein n=1 Tax=Human feces smacovirus 3 TaxID=1820159 RepID=A0A346M156_9VIRU|nr:putative capsid protein [Human feces smacovirus 3]